MYCVKCGVKLQDGIDRCPLCDTPVWNPESEKQIPNYPDRYPEPENENERIAFTLTAFTIISEIVLFLVAINVPDGWSWGGISMLGVVLGFIILVLPLWIKNVPAFAFVAVDHLAIGAYLLYICSVCNGNWFMSFAFPLVVMHLLLTTAMAVLIKYTRRGRFFLFGGVFVLLGLFTILIEFFAHISFGYPMFAWSVYSASVLSVIGLFLLLAGMIKPMGEFLKRQFFY